MNTKFLSILMAVAIALAFCDSIQASNASASDNSKSTSEKSEKVDEPKDPTGDVAKDAQMAAEEALNCFNNFKAGDDIKDFEKKVEEIEKKYEEFYKTKGEEELKKFQEELKKVTSSPEFMEKYIKAIEEMNKKLPEGTHIGMTPPESIPE